MIFYFDRIFGSKDRERLELFKIEADSFEVAIQTITDANPKAKVERRGSNLFLSWKNDGKDCFDNYFPCLTPPQEADKITSPKKTPRKRKKKNE